MRRTILLSIASTALVGLLASPVAAHTESDVVAVPAGEEATVKLKPTHGCDGSPTIAVAIEAPVEGATAQDVEGWTATATADGEGSTVLEWTGGSLPADQTGEFPVDFVAPDAPGELLTFPSIQTCDNGEELSWIDGDPNADFPAPRILILPAGSEPAPTIDDVPADAPGRGQLVQIIDIDNSEEAETTTTEAAPAETTAPEVPETTVADDAADDSEDEDSNTVLWIALAVAVLGGGGAAFYAYEKKKRQAADAESTDGPEAT